MQEVLNLQATMKINKKNRAHQKARRRLCEIWSGKLVIRVFTSKVHLLLKPRLWMFDCSSVVSLFSCVCCYDLDEDQVWWVIITAGFQQIPKVLLTFSSSAVRNMQASSQTATDPFLMIDVISLWRTALIPTSQIILTNLKCESIILRAT